MPCNNLRLPLGAVSNALPAAPLYARRRATSGLACQYGIYAPEPVGLALPPSPSRGVEWGRRPPLVAELQLCRCEAIVSLALNLLLGPYTHMVELSRMCG